jgi:hypothetical protein
MPQSNISCGEPALARPLDLEETRLPMGEDFKCAGREAMQIFERCLAATGMVTRTDLAVTTRDLFAIIKGLVDSAGQRGEADRRCLRPAFVGPCSGT